MKNYKQSGVFSFERRFVQPCLSGRGEARRTLLQFLLIFVFLNLFAGPAVAKGQGTPSTTLTTYILAVDCSGSMFSRKPEALFDPSRNITRWPFLRENLDGFLKYLEEGTEVHLFRFANGSLPPREYTIDSGKKTSTEILADIDECAAPAMNPEGSTQSAKQKKAWLEKYGFEWRPFIQKTELYSTLAKIIDHLRAVAGTRRDRPIDVLFFADGLEDASRYSDKALRNAPDNQARGKILSERFRHLVQEEGYSNIWLYFTWILNKQQFSSLYADALAGKAHGDKLAGDLQRVLDYPPLASTPQNHIIYDQPYPKLSLHLTPREVALASPVRNKNPAVELQLSMSPSADAILAGQEVSLRLDDTAARWLELGVDSFKISREKLRIPLNVRSTEGLDLERVNEVTLNLTYPTPEQLGGFKVLAVPSIQLRFSSASRPDLVVQEPRGDQTYVTGKPVLMRVKPTNANIEWHIGSNKTVLKGEQVEFTFEKPYESIDIRVVARDPEASELTSEQKIGLNVVDLSLAFDVTPKGNRLEEGEQVRLSVLGNPQLTEYRWTLNHDARFFKGKNTPRTDGKSGEVASFSLVDGGEHSVRVSAGVKGLNGVRINASPEPLILHVEPKPRVSLIAQDPRVPHPYYSHNLEPENGLLLTAEVLGARYDNLIWSVEYQPSDASPPKLIKKTPLRSHQDGWRFATNRLNVVESSGIRQLTITVKALSKSPNQPELQSDPMTLIFEKPPRDAEIVQPPRSAVLYFNEGEEEFTAEIIGRRPLEMVWNLKGPGGDSLLESTEPVTRLDDGRWVSRFRHAFQDPEYRYKDSQTFTLETTLLYADGTRTKAAHGEASYQVAHKRQELMLTLDRGGKAVAWGTVFQARVARVSDLERSVDVETVDWKLIDENGKVASWTSHESTYQIDLGQFEGFSPYGVKQLSARVVTKDGASQQLPLLPIQIQRQKPEISLLIDGNERIAGRVTFGNSVTINDKSPGDVVSRNWLINRYDAGGNILSTKEVAELENLSIESRSTDTGESIRIEVSLQLIDPLGEVYKSKVPVVLHAVPPRPWWLLIPALVITVLGILMIVRCFISNQVKHWSIQLTNEAGEHGSPLFGEGLTTLRRFWSRACLSGEKEAVIPMSKLFHEDIDDEYWGYGDGSNMSLVVKAGRKRRGFSSSIITSRGAPLANLYSTRRSKDVEYDDWSFDDPRGHHSLYLRVKKSNAIDWIDRIGVVFTSLIIIVCWSWLTWYLVQYGQV